MEKDDVPELSLLKCLPLTYHQHIFISFFIVAFWGHLHTFSKLVFNTVIIIVMRNRFHLRLLSLTKIFYTCLFNLDDIVLDIFKDLCSCHKREFMK